MTFEHRCDEKRLQILYLAREKEGKEANWLMMTIFLTKILVIYTTHISTKDH
jgi:hypothetical protein